LRLMPRGVSPRIFRILLEVQDLPKSRRFYESLLAVRGRSVDPSRIYFDCGPTILGLVDPSGEDETNARGSPEPVYFSTTELEAIYLRARRLRCLSTERIHGGDPAGEIAIRPWGERSFYAHDLSGNPLCFVDSRTLFTGKGRSTANRTPVNPRGRTHLVRAGRSGHSR
jgi:catechol 2,3-dioxygenase-like lactoylglutathione lyase family enzyme